MVPSTAALEELTVRLAPLREAFPEARWTASDDLHLTLVFLGAVPAALVPAVSSVVATVAADGVPFRLAVRGAGRFGGRGRPSVSWLGIDEGARSVEALEAGLRRRLAALPGLQGMVDAAPSVPHLTVARRVPDGLGARLRDVFLAADTSWTVDRLVLYRSDLGRQGARHEAILSAPLGRGLRPMADHG